MSFDFDSTRSFTTLDHVYDCLNRWSQELPEIECKKEKGALSLTILKEDHSVAIIRIQNVFAQHEYQLLNDKTSLGVLGLSKRYHITVKGNNEQGKNFIFEGSLSYNSEDGGKSWSTPMKSSFLSWK